MYKLLNATAVLFAATTAASAADFQTTKVLTHPSQGDVTVVENATSHLAASDDAVFVSFETQSLTPGDVHTLWFVTIANPSACASTPCSGADVLKNADRVMADVTYGDGVIADENGHGKFAMRQDIGALDNGWFGHGFAGAETSEIHLVIKNHGPLIEGRSAGMLGSFRDACTEESIPNAFPEIARADGAPGPNTCAMVQFSVFNVDHPES